MTGAQAPFHNHLLGQPVVPMHRLSWTIPISTHFNRALLGFDRFLFEHSSRVCRLAVHLGEALDVDGHDLAILALSARLHDVGKMAIPGGILNHPGPLDDAETTIMRSHSVQGERLVRSQCDIPFGDEVATIVRHHHEHWDGSGYPDGLRRQATPFLARIVAVADSWDALLSPRPYHPGCPASEVLHILRSERGFKHDPGIVDVFIEKIVPFLGDS
ncbi:MAG: HD domain-containing protein [Rhodanobacter sp.]|nr:MAG: HD domain-containing protein [Rhodanobacter sp.]